MNPEIEEALAKQRDTHARMVDSLIGKGGRCTCEKCLAIRGMAQAIRAGHTSALKFKTADAIRAAAAALQNQLPAHAE